MTYQPTKEELDELGLKHTGNIRKKHQYFMVNDSYRAIYHRDKGFIEITIMSMIPQRKTYIIQSLEDLKNLIRILTTQ